MPFKNPHPLYNVWMSMKDRCRNPNNVQYRDYGGRGIRVCDRWLALFSAFVEDMGPRPHGYSLDRIENDGNYEPGNCRWATRKEQQRNRRNAVYVEIDGQKYRAIELAEQIGVKADTVIERAKRGLSLSEVLDPNPSHDLSGLSLGGAANGRRQRAKTHCPQGHAYTPDNLVKSKIGVRHCKTCARERAAARRILGW